MGPTSARPLADIEWKQTPEDGVYDLWIDGRIAEYDVPEEEQDQALRRARVDP